LLSGISGALVAASLLPQRAGAVVSSDPLYLTAFNETFNRHARVEKDGTTYVSTGDIPAMWLRDSAAVALPYIELAGSDPGIASLLRGVLARQAKCILKDPYANAFGEDYRVIEQKFEADSLLYPIWFAALYYKLTHDRSIFTPEVGRAFKLVLKTLRTEQHHATRSHYRNPQLANGGRGSDVAYTGMIWTGFRPSDDAARYQYNIPVNMFAVVVMRMLGDLERDIFKDSAAAQDAWGLGVDAQRGIEQYGYCYLDGFGKIYSYEVDGLGHANLMDDANIPSLLSIPYFGYLPVSDPAYQRTRRFVLSPRNPYFYSGKYAEGVGSPHTPRGYVWPLALVMQALTSTDRDETNRVLRYIAASDTGDHRLHESFDVDNPRRFTRADFAWPNALYAQLVQQRQVAAEHT
jgi:meiotically up-regulated gene 157 (Mug157) protein